MKFYKIICGFNDDQFLPITENELPTAFALFIEGKGRGIFDEGVVLGQDIRRIVPDWHRVRGWNRAWKMTTEDYADVKEIETPYQRTYREAKQVAEYALKSGKRELLLKPLAESIVLVESQRPRTLLEGARALGEKLKVT